jgi:hypothetical protein
MITGIETFQTLAIMLQQPRHAEEWSDGELVWGRFNDTYLLNGWGQLEIHTNPLEDDVLTMRAAGYFEGFVTGERIEQHAHNIGVQGFNLSKDVVNFIDTNRYCSRGQYVTCGRPLQGHEMYSHQSRMFLHNFPPILESGHTCQGQEAPCSMSTTGTVDTSSALIYSQTLFLICISQHISDYI